MEGLLVDELDWYQGSGFLDENRLRWIILNSFISLKFDLVDRLATGTHLAPGKSHNWHLMVLIFLISLVGVHIPSKMKG
jgi:hypothetical protein